VVGETRRLHLADLEQAQWKFGQGANFGAVGFDYLFGCHILGNLLLQKVEQLANAHRLPLQIFLGQRVTDLRTFGPLDVRRLQKHFTGDTLSELGEGDQGSPRQGSLKIAGLLAPDHL
jgi:hypothetical protein